MNIQTNPAHFGSTVLQVLRFVSIRIPVFVRYGGDDGAPLRGHRQPKSAPVCVAVRTAEPGRYTLACYLEIPSLRCRARVTPCHVTGFYIGQPHSYPVARDKRERADPFEKE